jgi:hypothetical protein
MIGATAIVVASATLLGVIIAGVELGRPRVRGGIDFLRAANGLYFLCFVVAPLYLQSADLGPIRAGQWAWMLRTPFHDASYAEASVLALVGYLILLAGYWLVVRGRTTRPVDGPITSVRYLWYAGVGVAVAGTVSLVVYALSVGGWFVFFAQALAFRGNDPPVVSRWAFLTNLAPLVVGAMLMFFALRQYARGAAQAVATMLGVAMFAASAAILFHQAGRAAFGAFLATIPLVVAVQRDRFKLRYLVVGGLVLSLLVVFGAAFFQLARDPRVLLSLPSRDGGAANALRSVVWEFSFPIASLANAIRSVPDVVDLRGFYDFPLAVAYLIPQRLTGLVHEPTVSMMNTGLFEAVGTIPTDLLSFGYFSLALPGALLTAFGLGAILGLGERLFPAGADPMRAGLRVSWAIVLGFRVMYADPQLFWRSGLYLLVTTVVLSLPSIARRAFPRWGGVPIPSRA